MATRHPGRNFSVLGKFVCYMIFYDYNLIETGLAFTDGL